MFATSAMQVPITGLLEWGGFTQGGPDYFALPEIRLVNRNTPYR